MVVGLDAQLVLHGLGQVAPEQLVEVFEQGFGAPDPKGEHRQHPQLAGHRGDAKGRQPGVLLLHHHIHRQADQYRWRQVKQLVEHRAGHRQQHLASVRVQGRDQPSQGRPPGACRSVRVVLAWAEPGGRWRGGVKGNHGRSRLAGGASSGSNKKSWRPQAGAPGQEIWIQPRTGD